jgi:hypothetical protein
MLLLTKKTVWPASRQADADCPAMEILNRLGMAPIFADAQNQQASFIRFHPCVVKRQLRLGGNAGAVTQFSACCQLCDH